MVAALASLLVVNVAFADRLQEPLLHSVDFTGFQNSGFYPPEIRYEIRTDRYQDIARFGIDQWNRLRPICIRRDTALQVSDVAINHGYYGTVGWAGIWRKDFFSADTITYNRYFVERNTYNDYYGLGVHEMGHALGLGHPSNSNDNEYFATHSIMYWRQSNQLTWRTYDRESYNKRWGEFKNSLQTCDG